VMAFLAITALGCVAILVIPRFTQRWQALNQYEHEHAVPPEGARVSDFKDPHSVPASDDPRRRSSHGYDPTPLANGEHQQPVAPHAAHLP